MRWYLNVAFFKFILSLLSLFQFSDFFTCALARKNLQLRLDSRRDVEHVSSFDMLQNLIIAQALERKTPKGDHLVEQDPVRPDVRHGGKEPIGQALWGHPPDGQHALTAEAVVVVFVHGSETYKTRQVKLCVKGFARL